LRETRASIDVAIAELIKEIPEVAKDENAK
jgi:hypothetical protein